MTKRPLAALLLPFALGACAVGPELRAACPSPTSRATPRVCSATRLAPPASRRRRAAARCSASRPARTCRAAGGPPSDRPPSTVSSDEALAHNPSLDVAQATLAAAYEEAEAQKGTLLPTLTGNGLASYQRAPNGGLQSPLLNQQRYTYALYNAQGPRSRTRPTIFGGDRRLIESLEAQAEARRYELEVTYLTLTTNVVLAAIQEAALRAQIEATEKVVAGANRHPDPLPQGGRARADRPIRRDASSRPTSRCRSCCCRRSRSSSRSSATSFTALAGRLPSDTIAQTFTLASLRLPTKLPVSLPSDLIAQRPDGPGDRRAGPQPPAPRSASALANRLPRFSITSDNGGSGITFGQARPERELLFHHRRGIAAALRRRQRSTTSSAPPRIALAAAEANYKLRVLTAFREVADVLRSLQIDGKAVAAGQRGGEVDQRQLRADPQGADGRPWRTACRSFLAQQTYLTALISSAQTRALQYADTAALFQVLGGGWWNRRDVAPARSGGDFFKFL